MDIHPISTCQESQATSLTSIHIQDSHCENIASIPPEANENLSDHNVFVKFLVVLLYPFYWILNFFLKYIMYYLLFVFLFSLWLVGTLSSLTFPFLLAVLLVLRFSQFIKRGEDYDKVTQVKMVVEWFMVINIVLLASGILLFPAFNEIFFKIHIRILGRPLRDWSTMISSNILFICGIRFILCWIIQKYMPRMTLEHNESGLKVIQATSDIVDCLLLWYLECVVMDYLPQHEIPELTTQKWIDVTIFVAIGWNIIALSTHLIVWSIHKLVSRYLNRVHDKTERSHRYLLLERLLSVKCLVYYGNGMKRSFNFMLSSLLLLLVWVFYLGSHLMKSGSKATTVRDFGTWTCTILLILSFLWAVKDFVLLSWEENAVYKRLSDKILEARKSLYFLGMLGRHSHDILKLRYKVIEEDGQSNGMDSTKNRAQIFMAKNLAVVDAYYRDKKDEDDNEVMKETRGEKSSHLKPKLSNKKRERVRDDLLKEETMTLFNIQQVAQYFLTAAQELSKETYTTDILRKLTPSDNR